MWNGKSKNIVNALRALRIAENPAMTSVKPVNGADSETQSDCLNGTDTSSEKSLTNETDSNDPRTLSRLKLARTTYAQFDNEIESFYEGLHQDENVFLDQREITDR